MGVCGLSFVLRCVVRLFKVILPFFRVFVCRLVVGWLVLFIVCCLSVWFVVCCASFVGVACGLSLFVVLVAIVCCVSFWCLACGVWCLALIWCFVLFGVILGFFGGVCGRVVFVVLLCFGRYVLHVVVVDC